jgi:hypothetical protein
MVTGAPTRLFYERVRTVLDLLGLVLFLVCIVGLAAAVTAAVVRISPTRDKPAGKQSS